MPKEFKLGAITGERLEYWLPKDFFRKVAPREGRIVAEAFCESDADKVIRDIATDATNEWNKAAATERVVDEYRHVKRAGTFSYYTARQIKTFEAAEKRLPKEREHADQLRELTDRIIGELKRLRVRGVKGRVPVCVYPMGGSLRKTPRENRRSFAIHERFHADVSREAEKAGVTENHNRQCLNPGAAMAALDYAYSPALHMAGELMSNYPPHALEELLARAEEVRVACKRGTKDCAAVRKRIAGELELAGPAMMENFDRFTELVREHHGTPLNMARKLLRSCKVSR